MTPRALSAGGRAIAYAMAFGVVAATPQQAPLVYRTDVDITRVAVAVLDSKRAPVPGLGPADFRVTQEGRAREVQVVLAPDDTALDVGVVIDFSTSVAEEWPEARAAAHEFLDSLQPSDCVFLVPFNDRVGPGVWGTPGAAELRQLLDEFPMQGLTHLYDAIREARDALVDRQLLRQEPELAPPRQPTRAGCAEPGAAPSTARRQALVVLTDGADLGSDTSYGDLLIGAWRAEIPVLSVAVGVAATSLRLGFLRRDTKDIRLLQDQLRELARVTGGQFFMQQQLRSGYAEILEVLRSLYVVGFRSEATTRWSELQVTVPGTSHRVVVQPEIFRVDAGERTGILEVRRGLLLAAAGRLEEAEASLRSAALAEPAELGPAIYLGMVREGLGRYAGAEEAFTDALARAPGSMAAHAGLARVALRRGDASAAWRHALAARAAGADVSTTIQALRGMPEPPDLEARLTMRVVGLLAPTTPDLQAVLATRDLRRRLALELQRADFAVTANTLAADVLLNLRIERYEEQGSTGGSLRATLEVWNLAGEQEEDQLLQIDDLHDSNEVERALREALVPLLTWMRSL